MTHISYPSFGGHDDFLHGVDVFLAVVGEAVAPGVLEDVFVLLGEVAEKVALLVLLQPVRQNVNVVVVDLGVFGEGDREHIG